MFILVRIQVADTGSKNKVKEEEERTGAKRGTRGAKKGGGEDKRIGSK